jgi:hypothetical protein
MRCLCLLLCSVCLISCTTARIVTRCPAPPALDRPVYTTVLLNRGTATGSEVMKHLLVDFQSARQYSEQLEVLLNGYRGLSK